MKVSFRSLAEDDIDPLLEFSRRMYGQASYQGSREYLSWLYRSNPHARGLSDCLIAVANDVLVGCIHRMALPCLVDGRPRTLLSLQNHVVEPSLRGGVGIMLLQRAATGAPIVFSPGVHGRLAEAYRRLRYSEIPGYWFVRTLNPLRAGMQLALEKVSRGKLSETPLAISQRAVKAAAGQAVSVSASPNREQLQLLARNMENQALHAGGARVVWTPELVEWRYFNPAGPRHLLVQRVKTGAWALLSVGRRSGVGVARLVEYDDAGSSDFMRIVLRAAAASGAAVALAFSAQPRFRERLLAAGWRLRRDPPASFAKGVDVLPVSAGAGDLGFESFPTRIIQ